MGYLHWIKHDGEYRCEASDAIPDREVLRAFVGGDIEYVRVLYKDRQAWMVVNETGLITGLPRNDQATEIYLANVRKQFPDAEDPLAAARDKFDQDIEARFGSSIKVTQLCNGDVYIAGDVVVLEGINVN